MTLSQYVEKRNGVPMGAPYSLRNMLQRSLGAGSFVRFWHYWNPIWGYYLARYVLKPSRHFLPAPLAVVFTFFISGLLHDIAVSLVKWQLILVFSAWFTLLGIIVVISQHFAVNYGRFPWLGRAAINVAILVISWQLCLGICRLVAS